MRDCLLEPSNVLQIIDVNFDVWDGKSQNGKNQNASNTKLILKS